jgi:hypothetical protein
LAYSLTHAEILDQREGVQLLALARFFGMSSDPRFQRNQERPRLLSDEALAYPGQAEIIEQEVARRKAGASRQGKNSRTQPSQPRLF